MQLEKRIPRDSIGSLQHPQSPHVPEVDPSRSALLIILAILMIVNLNELSAQYIGQTFGISRDSFLRVATFIDFGNVNYWYSNDMFDSDGQKMDEEEYLRIDLNKLSKFLSFSSAIRFYYGHDPENRGSMSFLYATREVFGGRRSFTKPIQKIKHYLDPAEEISNTRTVKKDRGGNYVIMPKCNFDVEISVDAIRLMDSYDTFCLLSSDSDFVSLITYLKKRGKKVILIKGGRITKELADMADKIINAQEIKQYITVKTSKKAKTQPLKG